MSDSARSVQRQPAREQGLITTLVTFPFRFFGVLCGSLFLSILIECVGMHFFWPEQRWHHAEGMLEYELDQLSAYFIQSMLVEEPGRTAHQLIETTYDGVFVRTGILDWARESSARARGSDRDRSSPGRFRDYLSRFYVHVEAYVLAASYTALTFLVRVLVLCLTLPLFVLAILTGLIDGLVRRDLRRFGAGRESGFVYHRARASIVPLAVLPWVIYLALPVSVHPLWILLPSAILLSVAVNIAAGSFKKYL